MKRPNRILLEVRFKNLLNTSFNPILVVIDAEIVKGKKEIEYVHAKTEEPIKASAWCPVTKSERLNIKIFYSQKWHIHSVTSFWVEKKFDSCWKVVNKKYCKSYIGNDYLVFCVKIKSYAFIYLGYFFICYLGYALVYTNLNLENKDLQYMQSHIS